MFPLLDRNIPHVTDMILSYLESKDLAASMLVCREWCQKAKPFLYERHITSQRKKGDIPLIQAVIFGYDHLVGYLLENYQDIVNEFNHIGWTALMVAAFKGRKKITRMLLEREDIDVNIKSRWTGRSHFGRSALSLAASQGRAGVVKMLLARREIHVNSCDDLGITVLMQACREMRVSVVEELLKHPDTDVNLRDINRVTALSHTKKLMDRKTGNSLNVWIIIKMLKERNAI